MKPAEDQGQELSDDCDFMDNEISEKNNLSRKLAYRTMQLS